MPLYCPIPSLPDAVLAAILGSLLTLFGVFLTNWHSARQQKRSLDHQSRETERQRLFDLKRAVFLDGSSSFAQVASMIGAIGRGDLASLNVSAESIALAEATNKIVLVAGAETARNAVATSTAINKLVLRFVGEVIPLNEVTVDLKILDSRHQEVSQRFNRAIEEIREARLVGNTERLALLQAELTDIGQQLELLHRRREKLWPTQATLQRTVLRRSMEVSEEASRAVASTVLAMRKELVASEDSAALDRQFELHRDQIRAEMATLLAALDSLDRQDTHD